MLSVINTIRTDLQELSLPAYYPAACIANAFLRLSFKEDIPVNKTYLTWLVTLANWYYKENTGNNLLSEPPVMEGDEITIGTLTTYYRTTPISNILTKYITASSPSKIRSIAYVPANNTPYSEVYKAINKAWYAFLSKLASQ